MPAAPGDLHRCVPVSFNIRLLQLRLCLPAVVRSLLCAGWRSSLGSSGQTGKLLKGFPNMSCTCLHWVTHPVETPTVGYLCQEWWLKEKIWMLMFSHAVVQLQISWEWLVQKMMQRCRHQQVLIYTSVVHKILSTTPLNTLRCPDVAICTDLTISTVGKCDTISVSIQNLTMVTEGKKTLFIVPVKAILK